MAVLRSAHPVFMEFSRSLSGTVYRLYFIGKGLSAVGSANTTVQLQWLVLLQLEWVASRSESLWLHMCLELQAQ